MQAIKDRKESLGYAPNDHWSKHLRIACMDDCISYVRDTIGPDYVEDFDVEAIASEVFPKFGYDVDSHGFVVAMGEEEYWDIVMAHDKVLLARLEELAARLG